MREYQTKPKSDSKSVQPQRAETATPRREYTSPQWSRGARHAPASIDGHASMRQRTATASPAQNGNSLLRLQRSYGNRYVQRLIQQKLTVSQPGDKYEQEADRVADTVVRMTDEHARAARLSAPGSISGSAQRLCPECEQEIQRQVEPEEKEEEPTAARQVEEEVEEEKEEMLQTNAGPGAAGSVSGEVESQILTLHGGGQPIPDSVRAYIEPRMGYDFSTVRMHTDGHAAQLARSINALAFTVGQDIVFGAGQYRPETTEGKWLLAHELTHVVQQTGGMKPARERTSLSQMGDIHEREANALAQEVTSGDTKLAATRSSYQPLPAVPTSATVLPLIQPLLRQVYFLTDRPDSDAPVQSADLNQALTTQAYLRETRGMAEGKNVSITGRASKEAPSSLSETDQRAYNWRLSSRRANAVSGFLRDSERPPRITGITALGDVGAESNIPVWRRVDVDVQEQGGRERGGCVDPSGLALSTVTAPPIGERGPTLRFDLGWPIGEVTGTRSAHRHQHNLRRSFVYGSSCECVDVASYRIEIYDIPWNANEYVYIHMSGKRVCCSTEAGTELNQACRGIQGGFSVEDTYERGEYFLFDPSDKSDRDLLSDVASAASILGLVLAVIALV